MKKIRIDITSDLMCPWCIIGFKRLSKALQNLMDKTEFELKWHPFELYPRMSEDGANLYEWLQEKRDMTEKQIIESREKITAKGKELNFIFNYNENSRIHNTSRAHQLLHWAGDFDEKQTRLKIALFEAHFIFNRNINDTNVLIEMVEKAGLAGKAAREILNDKRYLKAVREKERNAKRQGISSIPFYLIDQRFKVEDSQTSTGFEDAIKAALHYQ